MSHEDELISENEALRIELGQTKADLLIANKQFNDAKAAVAGYIEEMKRIGTSTQALLKQVAEIQAAADAVRRRLGQTQLALVAAGAYVTELLREDRATSYEADARQYAKEAYTEALKLLETPNDGNPQ